MGKLEVGRRSFADPRTCRQALRRAHFASYSYARRVRRLNLAADVFTAPHLVFSPAEIITIGVVAHVGEFDTIQPRNSRGLASLGLKVVVGRFVTINPFDRIVPGRPVMDQDKVDQHVIIDDAVRIGVNVVALAGVTMSDDAIVATGAVIIGHLPRQCTMHCNFKEKLRSAPCCSTMAGSGR